MNKIDEKEIGVAITYKKLKKVIEPLEKMNFKDEDMVSFEYIIGSCFPNIYDNIQKRIREVYTQGYIDGQKEKEEEKEYLN